MPFTYGDAVRVTSAPRKPEYVDQVGTIVGIGTDEGSGVSFAVAFTDGCTASFWESELQLPQPAHQPTNIVVMEALNRAGR